MHGARGSKREQKRAVREQRGAVREQEEGKESHKREHRESVLLLFTCSSISQIATFIRYAIVIEILILFREGLTKHQYCALNMLHNISSM